MSVNSSLQDNDISSREYTALRDEMSLLRQALAALTDEVTVLRVAQAQSGRMPPRLAIGLASMIVAIGAQTAYAVYWGGSMTAQMEMVRARVEHTSQMIDKQVEIAGPFRSGIDRIVSDMDNCEKRVSALEQIAVRNQTKIDAIEQRNSVADGNWEIVKRNGLLVESTHRERERMRTLKKEDWE